MQPDETTGVLPRVTPCSDGSLCCDDDDHCCDDGNGVFLDNEGQIADSAPSTTYSYGPERTAATFRTSGESTTMSVSKTTSKTSTTVAAETTSSAAAATSSSSDDGGSNSTGMAVGLGVGLSVASLVIGGLFFIFWWKRRSARKAEAASTKELQGEFAAPKNGYYGPTNYEIPSQQQNYELPITRPPVELD